MLHFTTDAPAYMVRAIMSLARGWMDEPTRADPAWVEAIIHVHEDDATNVMHALSAAGCRVAPRGAARVAIADPTFVMAAASLEREGSSGTPSVAQVW